MSGNVSRTEQELYFLIAKFLEAGPCHGAANVLKRELEENRLLPTRLDWEGHQHFRSYENLVDLNKHVAPNDLLQMCDRLGPILAKEVKSNVQGVRSLLGVGRQSLLRTQKDVEHTQWQAATHTACIRRQPLLPPTNLTNTPNIVHIHQARHMSGCVRQDHAVPTCMYNKISLLSRCLGHLSAVYCVCFDRSGKYIFTGADDQLIKIWSAVSGRLIATLRGHAAEITDMAVNYENTLLAAGSCDKFIRVWCLKTVAPVAVLHGHTGMVTSLQFCPLARGDSRYLLSTGADACICFWEWNVSTNLFNHKPIKFVERSRAGAQMLCSSFSPGGVFLATGSSDSVVRVFCFSGSQPEKICELEAHTDRVDSIQYARLSERFVSGSKDGTARIWRFETQQWRAVVLNAAQRQTGTATTTPEVLEDAKAAKTRVTMVCWSKDDHYVITAVSDLTLRVWNPNTGALVHILQGHTDEVFVLEHHPSDIRILLSAGHDGKIILWDLITGTQVTTFFNMIEGQGHGAVFDCKWAPDGQSFAGTDSHGFSMIYGYGSNERFKELPTEMFFHTDYRPLIRDGNNYVLDEQTQQPPHLMPPAFLVDIDGNPHPPRLQRLVPGREELKDNQLIPQMGVTPSGDQEVLDDALEEPAPPPAAAADMAGGGSADGPRNLDEAIERLQHQQDQQAAAAGAAAPRNQAQSPARREPMSPPHSIRGPRRSGEMEGVRLASGNVLVSQRATESDIVAWRRRVVVRELDPSLLKASDNWHSHMADEEIKRFVTERKRKPALPDGNDSSDSSAQIHTRRKQKKSRAKNRGANDETGVNRLTARALYDTEEELTEETPGTEAVDESDKIWSSSSSDGESSEYSDWVEDTGFNLQPPKRSQRKIKRKRYSSSEEEEDEPDDMYDDDEDEKPKKKADLSKKKYSAKERRQREKQQMWDQQEAIQELPDEFRPPEWLTDTIPRKSPYVPQIGDEVMYFQQGHFLYVHAVKRRKIYNINPNKNQPWHKLQNLREMELVKVVGIKYEIRPPRLVCLKLAFIDGDTGRLAGGSFTVKYHDMPDVIDFLVLRQNYETAVKYNWKVGDRFRSMIDDAWWTGTIESQEPYQPEFPDSMFHCFNVKWDNAEPEKMSPWDFEPIDKIRLPTDNSDSVPVTANELKELMYQPRECEWPPCTRNDECDRIAHGLERIMELRHAEQFLTPVDLSAFPVYAMTIEYPIDLSTIKARLENRYYRRVSSIQYDVRYIESNAAKFNREDSVIVKMAKFITELCLRLISDTSCDDPMPIYQQLSKDVDFTPVPRLVKPAVVENQEIDVEAGEGTSSGQQVKAKVISAASVNSNLWKGRCQALVLNLLECEDSEPFREPVDINLYPDYYRVVDKPIDLGSALNDIGRDVYSNPMEFSKDIRTIFSNSRAYNTNKRSKIYAMTLRMSAMFEDKIKTILADYKKAIKCEKVGKKGPGTKTAKGVGKSTSPTAAASGSKPKVSSASPSTPSQKATGAAAGTSTGTPSGAAKAGNVGRGGGGTSGTPRSARPGGVSKSTTNGYKGPSTTTTKSGRTVKRKRLATTSDDDVSDSGSEYGSKPKPKKSVQKKKHFKSVNGHSRGGRSGPGKRPRIPSSDDDDSSASDSNSDTELDSDNTLSEVSLHSDKVISHAHSGKTTRSAAKKLPRTLKNKSTKSRARDSSSSEAESGDFIVYTDDERTSRPKTRARRRQKRVLSSDAGSSSSSSYSSSSSSDADSATELDSDNTEISHDSSSLKQRTKKVKHKSDSKMEPHSHSQKSFHKKPPRKTRSRGQRTVTYNELSDDGEEDCATTVSSRGRVRKLTPRARALYGDS